MRRDTDDAEDAVFDQSLATAGATAAIIDRHTDHAADAVRDNGHTCEAAERQDELADEMTRQAEEEIGR